MSSSALLLCTRVVCGTAIAMIAATAHAQSARYVRVAVGSAQLEAPTPDFSLSSVRYPSVAVGTTSPRGHGVELHFSRLDVETTEPRHPSVEAPYTVGIRAITIELAYYYQPTLGSSRLRPRVGAGVAFIPVVDRWRSDTPTESASSTLFGASASVGLAARLVGPASAAIRAGYHFADDGGSSRAMRVGLTGYRVEAGIELGF